jgi:hypothetical protein
MNQARHRERRIHFSDRSRVTANSDASDGDGEATDIRRGP